MVQIKKKIKEFLLYIIFVRSHALLKKNDKTIFDHIHSQI